LTASDGALTTDAFITVSVLNVNEAPQWDEQSPSFSVAEDAPVFTRVGSAAVSDPDGARGLGAEVDPSATAERALFEALVERDASMSASQATVVLRLIGSLDYEMDASYTVPVIISDGELQSSMDITVTVTNVNDMKVTNATGALAHGTRGGDYVTFTGTGFVAKWALPGEAQSVGA